MTAIRTNPRLRSFIGWKPAQAPAPTIQGVSGATLTSYAVAESIQRRLVGAAPSLRFPEPVSLEEVRALFTNVARIVPDHARLRVLDPSGPQAPNKSQIPSSKQDWPSGKYHGNERCACGTPFFAKFTGSVAE